MVEQSEPATPRPKRVRSPSSLLRKTAKARAAYAAKSAAERSAPYQKRQRETGGKKIDKRKHRPKRGDDGNAIWTTAAQGPITR